MINRINILMAIGLFFFSGVIAQQQNTNFSNFEIRGRMIDGKPVIKIFPLNQAAWFLGIKNGYTISVSDYENGQYSTYKSVITNLRPAAEIEFRNLTLPNDYAEAMRKAVYEENFAPSGKSFDDMLKAEKKMGLYFFSYMLLSSYDPMLSKISGLQTQLLSGLEEKFKIKVEINNFPEYTTEQIMLKEFFYTELKSPDFSIKQGDKQSTLTWNYLDYGKFFVAYIIERSNDGKNFKQMGLPTVYNKLSDAGRKGMISVTDSLSKNYSDYWYRVRGFDAFGFLSESPESKIIQGRDMIAPSAPFGVRVKQTAVDSATVSWTPIPSSDLEGFQVIGSKSETGQYHLLHKKLLPPDQTSFSFNISNELFKYYRVLSVDTARNTNASDMTYLVVMDTIPPEIPDSIVVEVDSNHIATIKWTPSKDEDIKGYRVFKAFHPSHGFVPITPIPVTDTIFTDSLSHKRQDKKIYYRVVSMDTHYNHSQQSANVYAHIPDFIPPTEPLLIKAEQNTLGHVELEWHLSSSHDVALYTVIRRIENETTYQIIYSDSSQINHFSDVSFDTLKANYAEYYISATDSSGNSSGRSNGKRVMRTNEPLSSAISKITAGDIGNMVEINWVYSSEKKFSVLIYRAEDENTYSLIDRVNDQSIYVDFNVTAGKRYSYKLGILESTGKRSPLSEETTVKLK